VTTEDQNQEEGQQPENTEPQEEKPPVAAGRQRASRRASASTEGDATPDADAAAPESAQEDAETAEKPAPRRRPSRARAPADSNEEPAPRAAVTPKAPPRMLERLRNDIGPTMVQEFGYTSVMQIPRPSKVVLNIGLGEALTNARALEAATRDMTLISGQRPVTTRAKKSIAGFKIREGMPIGLSVTLRGRRMYEFIDRLISSTLPRIRDLQVPLEALVNASDHVSQQAACKAVQRLVLTFVGGALHPQFTVFLDNLHIVMEGAGQLTVPTLDGDN